MDHAYRKQSIRFTTTVRKINDYECCISYRFIKGHSFMLRIGANQLVALVSNTLKHLSDSISIGEKTVVAAFLCPQELSLFLPGSV
jgi:hypothetical protein